MSPPAPVSSPPRLDGRKAPVPRLVSGKVLWGWALAATIWTVYSAFGAIVASKADASDVKEQEAKHDSIHKEHDAAIVDIRLEQVRQGSMLERIELDVRRVAQKEGIPAPASHPTPTGRPAP